MSGWSVVGTWRRKDGGVSSSNPSDPGRLPGEAGGWGPPIPAAGVPSGGGTGSAPSGADERCYVHPERPAASVCRRCGRPICTDCMREAPVGWQCARCVRHDSRRAPVTRWQPRARGTLGATRLTPLVMVIVAINVIVFVIEEADFNSIVDRFSLVPYLTIHQPYRLITAAFLHANFTHILLNMLALVIIGPALEAAVGKGRFVAVYLISAVGGEVLSYLVGPIGEVSLGASGAIFGVMGAYLILARRRRWDLSIVVPLIGINLLFSFLDPAIDWRAHVGGLAVGALLAWVFSWAEERPASVRRAIEPLACVGVLVVLGVLSRIPPGHVGI